MNMKNEMYVIMAEDPESVIEQKKDQEQKMEQVIVPVVAISLETFTTNDTIQEEMLRNHSRTKIKGDSIDGGSSLNDEDKIFLMETKSAIEATESFGIITDFSQAEKLETTEVCDGAVGIIDSNQVIPSKRKEKMLDYTKCNESYCDEEEGNLDNLQSSKTLSIKCSKFF